MGLQPEHREPCVLTVCGLYDNMTMQHLSDRENLLMHSFLTFKLKHHESYYMGTVGKRDHHKYKTKSLSIHGVNLLQLTYLD